MNEKTSMFRLLNERMEKEDIVKLVCDYDNKFNEACIDEDVEYFCDDLRYDDCKKLLDILKGSDKE